jgi:hypothetical protein
MDVLDLIENQLIANRLPIVAVTLTAVPHGNTPVVLALHWHGFVEVRLAEGSQPVAFQPVPSSVLQVNSRWDRCDDLDNGILEAAWELGAWNLERKQVAPFRRLGADAIETTLARHAFGKLDRRPDEPTPVVAEAPDLDDLIDAAGRSGYVQWLFRPVRGGLWPAPPDDITLEKGGYRNPACPLVGKPMAETNRLRKLRMEVYALGRSVSLVH